MEISIMPRRTGPTTKVVTKKSKPQISAETPCALAKDVKILVDDHLPSGYVRVDKSGTLKETEYEASPVSSSSSETNHASHANVYCIGSQVTGPFFFACCGWCAAIYKYSVRQNQKITYMK